MVILIGVGDPYLPEKFDGDFYWSLFAA